ncbi:13184_t:CDS:2 [Funneliformis caledonium]|uniref:13184_t:CDS:1 n=1 Tax=Funneliformis caledonium TaxID=1117310 RepID=A0A9N8VRE6_9GLOM|nr:13184_t:CDS:2 [Funneliformis caledonium]
MHNVTISDKVSINVFNYYCYHNNEINITVNDLGIGNIFSSGDISLFSDFRYFVHTNIENHILTLFAGGLLKDGNGTLDALDPLGRALVGIPENDAEGKE